MNTFDTFCSYKTMSLCNLDVFACKQSTAIEIRDRK